jgi:molybdate transport system ATP-binding protein
VSLRVDVELRLPSFLLRVEFAASQGITALFGPSGAGKTLTLRCIAGLSRPDAGAVRLGERVLLDTRRGIELPPRDRRIGYVFQQYALFPHLSVARNVAYGIADLSAAERGARVDALLELVGLPGMRDRRPAELSGGQQQRVALARALATEPHLLLLDEPFAAVDLRVRRRLRSELRRIHDLTGTPMLLVTHDLDEVRQLSDELVLLDHGRVLRAGATPGILTRPYGPELIALLEEPLD